MVSINAKILEMHANSHSRRAFLVQCPPTVLAIILVEWKLKAPQKTLEEGNSASHKEKLKRIDFLGALFMSMTILAALIVLDTAGQKFPFTHPIIIASIVVTITGGFAFCMTERYWAKEPIFPLQLLTHYTVVTSYSILALQNFAQVSVSTVNFETIIGTLIRIRLCSLSPYTSR